MDSRLLVGLAALAGLAAVVYEERSPSPSLSPSPSSSPSPSPSPSPGQCQEPSPGPYPITYDSLGRPYYLGLPAVWTGTDPCIPPTGTVPILYNSTYYFVPACAVYGVTSAGNFTWFDEPPGGWAAGQALADCDTLGTGCLGIVPPCTFS